MNTPTGRFETVPQYQDFPPTTDEALALIQAWRNNTMRMPGRSHIAVYMALLWYRPTTSAEHACRSHGLALLQAVHTRVLTPDRARRLIDKARRIAEKFYACA